MKIDLSKSPLDILRACRGFYRRPEDANGKGIGPLVAYAGKDKKGRNYVGRVYANFAMAEEHGDVLKHFANLLIATSPEAICHRCVGFCGAPEGGKALATALAIETGLGYIYPEKLVTVAKTDKSREESDLVFSRHEPKSDETWWLVEDVCNSFSTTEKLIALIESYGAKVGGILCFLNRSSTIREGFTYKQFVPPLPIFAVVRESFDQFEQDDPSVADDVSAKNVVWKPKNDWAKLEAAMEQAEEVK